MFKITLASVIFASGILTSSGYAEEFVLQINPSDNPAAAVAELSAAIESANLTVEPDIIRLYPDSSYFFTDALISNENGNTALPAISTETPDAFSEIKLIGSDSIFLRDENSAPFRFLEVSPNGRLTVEKIRFQSGSHSSKNSERHDQGGGAIFNLGKLAVIKCAFDDNFSDRVGGAIYGRGEAARTTVTESQFTKNHAGLFGGAVDSTGALVHLIKSQFIENTASSQGGAFGVANGDAVVQKCIFQGNSANFGGAVRTYGILEINETIFENNTSTDKGGALFLYSKVSSVTLTDSQFINNESTAAWGGAIDLNDGYLHATKSTFIGNKAGASGGAISNGGIVNLSECLFEKNFSNVNGGALNNGNTMVVTNSSFAHNHSNESGGAISNNILKKFSTSAASFKNNTFTANTCDADNNSSGDGGAIAHFKFGNIIVSNNTVFENIDRGGEANDISGFIASTEDSLITDVNGSEGLESDFIFESVSDLN